MEVNNTKFLGKFVKVRDRIFDTFGVGTSYLVVGVVKLVIGYTISSEIFDCQEVAYILLDIKDNRMYISYVYNYYPDYISYSTFIQDIDTGTTRYGMGVSCDAWLIKPDCDMNEILKNTSKESRLENIRSAIKYIQWVLAKSVYDNKYFCFHKLPTYRNEMRAVLGPYFNPDKYIIGAL